MNKNKNKQKNIVPTDAISREQATVSKNQHTEKSSGAQHDGG